jgi:hypothetical protein
VVGSIWRLMTTPSVGIIPFYANALFGLDINIGRDATTAFMFTVVMDIWHWTLGRQDREPDFDLIEPGCFGGGEMDVRVTLQPAVILGLVCVEIVERPADQGT